MDRYDPEKKLALAVDEWGAWYAPATGSNPGFLQQQNSLRDGLLAALNLNIFARHAERVRIANIAQMVNVLQAMILTEEARMLLTPTYQVFRMYVPFQNARVLPLQIEAGTWSEANLTLPHVDAIAARAVDGRVLLAFSNLHPSREVKLDIAIDDAALRRVSPETLTVAKVDSVNTFDAPTTVTPKPLTAKLADGRLRVTLPARSVRVVGLGK
ncbi:MAG: alpha-L-arabinofuranosidase C-terminal domain-containing protein [Lysobacterales bacterium]